MKIELLDAHQRRDPVEVLLAGMITRTAATMKKWRRRIKKTMMDGKKVKPITIDALA